MNALAARIEPTRDAPMTYPMTFEQKGLWLLHQGAAASAAYNLIFTAWIESRVDPTALSLAFRGLQERHPILMAGFGLVGKQPMQKFPALARTAEPEFAGSGNRTDREALEAAAVFCNQPFDLDAGPVVRLRLETVNPQHHLLAFAIHHIAADFKSVVVLIEELGALYGEISRPGSRPPLPPPMGKSYLEWSKERQRSFSGEAAESGWQYWRDRLAGAPLAFEIPSDHPRPPLFIPRGASHPFRISREIAAHVKEFARARGITEFVLLTAVFQSLLHRYSGQDDFLIGSPATGRTGEAYQRTVGNFANLMLLRADFSGEPRFLDFLERTRGTVLGALSHQDFPFPLLVEKLQPKRDASRPAVAQAAFVYQKIPKGSRLIESILSETAADPLDWGGMTLRPLAAPQQEGQFELALEIVDSTEGMAGVLKYHTDLFTSARMERMASHFLNLLVSAMESPERRIADLDLMEPAEASRILTDWNSTRAPLERRPFVHVWFEARARLHPDAIALSCADGQITYRELNGRANHLSRRLREMGVGPEVPVGLCLKRSMELIVGILATLKAGGAFVPVDPELPPDRIEYMTRDAGLGAIVAHASNRDAMLGHGVPVAVAEESPGTEEANPDIPLEPDNLAYIIYTSGSTGMPKGAMNTHLGLGNRLAWMQNEYPLDAYGTVLQKTPASFDVSVWELLWSLTVGAKMEIAIPGGHRDPVYLRNLMAERNVTVVHFVPSLLNLFLEVPDAGAIPSLRHVICSGEALGKELEKKYFAVVPSAELHNLYGPTEAAIDVTYWKCAPGAKGASVPIGRPIWNTETHILDTRLRPTPIGVAGELNLSGFGLARGYVRRPDLTAACFRPNPFAVRRGDRSYRTGDSAHYRDDGQIEYLGRLDHQVKIRGFRIELGEVEAALARFPGVLDAAVAAVGKEYQKHLAAFLIRDGGEADKAELRRFLKASLPEYMVPSVFVFLPAFPLTASGKLDRRALMKMGIPSQEDEKEIVLPRNQVEALIAEAWRSILEIERIGVEDDFFASGGHSLKAVQLRSQLNRLFRMDLSLPILFEAATIAAQAELLTRLEPTPGHVLTIAKFRSKMASMTAEEKKAALLSRGM